MSKGEASLLVKIQTKGAELLDNMIMTIGDLGNAASFVGGKIIDFAKNISDLVFEGSKLEQIDQQFEYLTKSAGIAADTLKKDLVGAVGGMVDDTDLIKAANRALVNMGEHAAELPKIMEIAKASAKLMGGEVTDRFDQITMAIQNANARGLRGTGIIIDQEAVFKKYAATLGLTSSQLNKAQESQALLNAVMDNSKGVIDASKSSADEVGSSYKKLKIALDQLHEIGARLMNEIFGPLFSKVFKNAAAAVNEVSELLTSKLGKGAEKTEANVSRLTKELDALNKAQESFDKFGFDMTGKEANLQVLQLRIKKTKEELAKFQEEQKVQAQQAENDKLEIEKKGSTKSIEQLTEMQIKRLELTKGQNELLYQNARDTNEANVKMMFADDEEKAMIQAQLNVKNAEMDLAQNNLLLNQTKDNKEKLKILEQNAQLQQGVEAAKFRVAELNNEKIKNEEMKKSRTEFLNNIATLQSVKNKELAMIGKAAAIAQITISGAESAAHAMKWGTLMGGPALGAVFSGLSYAATAAQIAKVSGVELAEGGIVMPRPGGTPAIIGEAGQAEAVIPLDKMGGMGGGVTIIVNGGLLGDESSAREFAIAVDRQLLELRRNNESVAFDSRVV